MIGNFCLRYTSMLLCFCVVVCVCVGMCGHAPVEPRMAAGKCVLRVYIQIISMIFFSFSLFCFFFLVVQTFGQLKCQRITVIMCLCFQCWVEGCRYVAAPKLVQLHYNSVSHCCFCRVCCLLHYLSYGAMRWGPCTLQKGVGVGKANLA